MEDATGAEDWPEVRHLQFLDLPDEVQREVFKQCSQCDLICLSLVSHHFHELAARQLYRNYHIVFPDEDDPAFDSPIDGLAGGLETFVTSEYDYAAHLRDLSLDTLSGGEKAAIAYRPYLYSVSCGKFMNTLLLLTLRKARGLEAFSWNIRVELSRQVYKALHQLPNLTHLHLRLQAGASLYESPPPLPITPTPMMSSPPPPPVHVAEFITPPPPQPPPPATGGLFGAPPPQFYLPPVNIPLPPPPALTTQPPKAPPRIRLPKRTSPTKEPPTLAGFKRLRSLAVLDMDTLDTVTELKTCVRNSASTLTKLSLSLSENLARQARKPVPEVDPDDSELEDELGGMPVLQGSGGNYDEAAGPARAYRAQEERKSQENVLGRIFDVEPFFIPKPPRRKDKDGEPKDDGKTPGETFINSIKVVAERWTKELGGSADLTAAQQEMLDIIEQASRKYVAEGGARPSSPRNATPPPRTTDNSASQDTEATAGSHGPSNTHAGASEDGKPEDIDVEAPVEDSTVEGAEDETPLMTPATPATPLSEAVTVTSTPTVTPAATQRHESIVTPQPRSFSSVTKGHASDPVQKALDNLTIQRANSKTLGDKLDSYRSQSLKIREDIKNEMTSANSIEAKKEVAEKAEIEMESLVHSITTMERELSAVQAEIADAEKQIPGIVAKSNTGREASQIHDYIRSTRGIALSSLCVYLVPVKASVLSKALDLRKLTRITLLNVGAQAPVWSLFAKENKSHPMALRKIFTDNVTTTFLSFVNELPVVHELFMLERSEKSKPESFAAKTNVTIAHIRRLVLRKHLKTIKWLMIKNQHDMSWDIDEKTMALLCRKGKNLQELAVSMGIRVMHTLSRRVQGLVNLRALQIINLRSDDTCVWVMRETKRFLIDSLSHYPDLKLEWLSVDDDDTVEHIVRVHNKPGEGKKSSDTKGKSKAGGVSNDSSGSGGSSQFPILNLDGFGDLGPESSDDDDDEEEEGDNVVGRTSGKSTGRVTLETIENIRFFDAWGVRIFRKEVVLGRL